MKLNIGKNKIRLALYLYTFIVVLFAIFTSFSIVSSTDRTAYAYAPGDGACQAPFGTIMRCTQSCIDGANGDQAWINGCYNSCVNICNGGTPNTCNDGRNTCDAPGETQINCPQDCGSVGGGNNNPPANPPATNPGYIGTIESDINIGCTSDTWVAYECTPVNNACTTYLQGCNPVGSPLVTFETLADAKAYIAATPRCSVRQVDCFNTAGVDLVFRSRINCQSDCYPNDAPPAQPPANNPPINPPPTNNPPHNPPPENPTPAVCEQLCGPSDNGRSCGTGLTCTNVGGNVNKCRLSDHPTWVNCQPPVTPPQVPQCNDLCNTTTLLCPTGLTCTNAAGQNRCRLPENPTSAICQPANVPPPQYKIEKVVEGNQGPFMIGSIVIFKIKITNTGVTTLTNVKFRDVYNSNYLTYFGGTASKSTGGSISDLNTVLTRNTTGTIEIENVALNSVLGPLSPNNYYEFVVKFIAKAPIDSTCNYGYADIPELPEVSANACVSSKNIDTDL